MSQSDSLENAARAHYSDLLEKTLRIETPDADVNRALAWANIALDQAWVCNPDLGCGAVAGYGPSRKARRPQYAWFFAGDGMVATNALLASGRYERAREELAFVLKYQDRKTGMIWHEMSQSAGQMDWSRYPYMFVHVDVTFDFIDMLAHYYTTTGDAAFLKQNWPAIQAAFRYCQSVIDAKSGVPEIPSDKQGFNEQDPLSEELTLSAGWVAASAGFATLATAVGQKSVAKSAHDASQRARKAVESRYWDKDRKFWISGYTRAGAPVKDEDIRPASVLHNQLFTADQRGVLLDRLSSADYQTDWGTRSKSSSDARYDPNAYASGSVWGLGSSTIAGAFWAEHRPAVAWPIWNALVSWSSLDSPGHMHEVAAGDFYHEEIESVPEQTWSSAAFLSTAVEGLLGLRVDGAARRLTFAPHLPPQWPGVTVRNVRINESEVTLQMTRSAQVTELTAENSGEPIRMTFAPQIPNAANGAASAHDSHASKEFTLAHGKSTMSIPHAEGGYSLMPAPSPPQIGEVSKGVKIVSYHRDGPTLSVRVDHPGSGGSFDLYTTWQPSEARGAVMAALGPGVWRITIPRDSQNPSPSYRRSEITLVLELYH